MRALGIMVLLTSAAAGLELNINIVEQDPGLALQLEAAVLAGLAEDARRAEAMQQEEEREATESGEEDEGFTLAVEKTALEPDDAFQLLQIPVKVCEAASQEGTHAILAGDTGGVGMAAAARGGVPLLLVGEEPGLQPQWEALAMRPRADLVLEAAKDLAREKGWSNAVLLHAGSSRPAALLAPDTDDIELFVRQLPEEDALLRDLMLMLKQAGFVNFLIYSDEEVAVQVLDAAQRVGLLAAKHSYIVLSFDFHTQDLSNFSHGGANITGLMFFNPTLNLTLTATQELREKFLAALKMENGDDQAEESPEAAARRQLAEEAEYSPETVPSALLLAYDAALVTARALRELALPEGEPGNCADGVGAFHGGTLLNYIRSMDPPEVGATGVLTWEADGWRTHNVLQVVELQRGGALDVTGSWSELDRLIWDRHDPPAKPLPSHTMTNRTFTVVISVISPYVMKKVSTEKQTGNARYEGFCIELIEELAADLHFNYTFVEQEDKEYGKYNETTKQWQGMLRTVMDDEDNLTLAITDLTITEEREGVVDFTTPFMNLGIAILFRRPKTPDPDMFAFLLPFSPDVWAYLGLAYLGSSLMLYFVGRLCPEEWQNPYPCIEEPDALENQFTLGNALWFNLGAILLQGSEVAPVGYSTRAVASVWWLFALVITSSYTANLATLLAKQSSNELIHDVHDLANNPYGITYGAKETGSTYAFFKNSQSPEYQEMFSKMKQWPMPADNYKGIANVSESFAFLMESTSIEYEVQRNCDLYMVGDLLDSKGYGIAMRKNSPYRQEMNLALLRLQEKGRLREMKHTWWEERNGGGACKPKEDRESHGLKMNSFYGLFVVLVTGCAVGLLLSCGDLAVHAYKHPRDPQRTFVHNFAEELRFVFRFDLSAKPVKGPLIPPKTPSIPSEQEVETEVDGEGNEEERGVEAGAGGRESALSGPRRRRRSSMHNASLRVARHLHSFDSGR